jgi:threonine/homoserine/homoserine lactone efflux protein
MFEATASALAGVVLGLSLAAPPGPMNAIIAEESVLRGFGAGVRAGMGAAVADGCFFVLALAGVTTILRAVPTVHAVMVGAGGLLMLYFAAGAALDARESFTADLEGGGAGFRKTFALALTNPYQILWWLTFGVGLLEPGRTDVGALVPFADSLVVTTGSVAIVAGFFAGILLWVVGFAGALVAAGRRVDRFAPAVASLSALALAGFGVVFLYDAVTRLL